MFGFQVDKYNVDVSRKHIERMLTTNPDVKKALQDVIRDELLKARQRLSKDVEGVFKDSRHEAWRAVRRQVYAKVLGGDLDIMNMKKGTAKMVVRQHQRKVDANPHMWGGNRRKRRGRTIQIDGYEGKARGFILRFVNVGTKQRFIGGRNVYKTNIEYLNRIKKGTGNRGRIAPRNFFGTNANRELSVAAKEIGKMIDAELAKIANKNIT